MRLLPGPGIHVKQVGNNAIIAVSGSRPGGKAKGVPIRGMIEDAISGKDNFYTAWFLNPDQSYDIDTTVEGHNADLLQPLLPYEHVLIFPTETEEEYLFVRINAIQVAVVDSVLDEDNEPIEEAGYRLKIKDYKQPFPKDAPQDDLPLIVLSKTPYSKGEVLAYFWERRGEGDDIFRAINSHGNFKDIFIVDAATGWSPTQGVGYKRSCVFDFLSTYIEERGPVKRFLGITNTGATNKISKGSIYPIYPDGIDPQYIDYLSGRPDPFSWSVASNVSARKRTFRTYEPGTAMTIGSSYELPNGQLFEQSIPTTLTFDDGVCDLRPIGLPWVFYEEYEIGGFLYRYVSARTWQYVDSPAGLTSLYFRFRALDRYFVMDRVVIYTPTEPPEDPDPPYARSFGTLFYRIPYAAAFSGTFDMQGTYAFVRDDDTSQTISITIEAI
jgi:hypothetical protein